jgi:hypothetical protein
LCKTRNTPVVVSEQVASRTRHAWRPLGSHAMAKWGKAVELFTL